MYLASTALLRSLLPKEWAFGLLRSIVVFLKDRIFLTRLHKPGSFVSGSNAYSISLQSTAATRGS
jgi:hypothetical protein